MLDPWQGDFEDLVRNIPFYARSIRQFLWGQMTGSEAINRGVVGSVDKDTLIEELKMALVRRELRINELELALYRQAQGGADVAVFSGAVAAIDRDASLGAHSDGWLSTQSTLVFSPGAEISLLFFLPPGNGGRPKHITLHPDFGTPIEFVLERGIGVEQRLIVPIATQRPTVRIECEYAEPVEDDRLLGVIVQ